MKVGVEYVLYEVNARWRVQSQSVITRNTTVVTNPVTYWEVLEKYRSTTDTRSSGEYFWRVFYQNSPNSDTFLAHINYFETDPRLPVFSIFNFPNSCPVASPLRDHLKNTTTLSTRQIIPSKKCTLQYLIFSKIINLAVWGNQRGT